MKWLRSLFKKAELEEFNIKSSELYEWFVDKSEPLVGNSKEEVNSRFNEIKEKCSLVKGKLEDLESASLKNDKIPERAKQIMQGNRETYVRFISNFLEEVEQEIPEEINYNNISNFVSFFEEKMDSLNKSTSKSFYVLQEFFANESSEIAMLVKEMDALNRNLLENPLKKIVEIKKGVTALESLLKKKKNAKENLIEARQSLNVTKNLIADTENNIKNLKESEEYKKLGDLLNEKKSVQSKLKNHENTLSADFSPLSRSMRKYARITLEGEKLLEDYAESPLNALLNDKDLKILDLLAKLKEAVESGQVEMKDKEKEKALEKIRQLSRDHLENMLSLYHSLKDQLYDVEKRIRLNNVMREIEEQEYKLSHLKDKLNINIENMDKLEKQKENKDAEKVKEKLEEDINSLLTDAHMNIVLEDEDQAA